jgi:hypothetical protein
MDNKSFDFLVFSFELVGHIGHREFINGQRQEKDDEEDGGESFCIWFAERPADIRVDMRDEFYPKERQGGRAYAAG